MVESSVVEMVAWWVDGKVEKMAERTDALGVAERAARRAEPLAVSTADSMAATMAVSKVETWVGGRAELKGHPPAG